MEAYFIIWEKFFLHIIFRFIVRRYLLFQRMVFNLDTIDLVMVVFLILHGNFILSLLKNVQRERERVKKKRVFRPETKAFARIIYRNKWKIYFTPWCSAYLSMTIFFVEFFTRKDKMVSVCGRIQKCSHLFTFFLKIHCSNAFVLLFKKWTK